MPGHTSFCEIIQHIRLTVNKATLKYNIGDLEEIIQKKNRRKGDDKERGF